MAGWFDQVQAAVAVRNFALADSVLSDWLARHPESAIARLALSDRLEAEGRLDEALVACDEGLGHDPEFSVLHAVRADLLRGLGRLDEAEKAVTKALAAGPDMPRALGAACRIAQARKDDARLSDCAHRLLAVLPEHTAGHMFLGGVALRARELDAAEDHARRILSINPEESVGHLLLAHVLLQKDRAVEALEAARRAQALAPGDKGVTRLVGKAASAAKVSRRMDWIARVVCGFGIGPALVAAVALWAVMALAAAPLDPVDEETVRKLIYILFMGPIVVIFVAIEHHLKRAKPDPKSIRLDPDY